jgi:O-antigen/teichoic acid export membrane protein
MTRVPETTRASEAEADATVADPLDAGPAGPAAIRGGAYRVGGYALGSLFSLAAAAVLFRHLGVVDTGRYNTAISLVAIVAGLSDLGLTAIGVRELSLRAEPERRDLVRNLLGLRFTLSAIGVIGVTAFAAGAGYGATLIVGVALAGLGLVLQTLQHTLALSLMSELRWGWVAAFDLLRQLATALLIVGLVVAGAQLLAFLAIPIPVSLIVLALTIWIVRGDTPLAPAFDAAQWKPVIRQVLPYSAAVAASTIYFRIAVVLVSLISTAHELGYFSASTRIIEGLVVVPGLLVGAAFPIFSRAARDDRERLRYALGRVFEVALLIGVWLAMCIAIAASIAIKIIGGATFGPAAGVLAIQAAGLGASFVGAVWAYGLLSLARYREIFVISMAALVVGSTLVGLLVELDGAQGAAIATASGEVLLGLLTLLALVRADPSLRPPLRVVPRVAVAAGLGTLSTLLDLPVLASVALASAIYAVTVVASGAVPAELSQALRRGRFRSAG